MDRHFSIRVSYLTFLFSFLKYNRLHVLVLISGAGTPLNNQIDAQSKYFQKLQAQVSDFFIEVKRQQKHKRGKKNERLNKN